MVESKIAIVTGANRGLGLETCRQLARHGLKVLLCARDAHNASTSAKALQDQGLDVTAHRLDVLDHASILSLRERVEELFGRLDILVNNAGIMIDVSADGGIPQALGANLDTIRQTMETNVFGALMMCQAFVPLMQRHGWGRIVNVSSGMGQLSRMAAGHAERYPAYRMSKAALNCLTLELAAELAGSGILVNAVCPGWVKTDMGGKGADLTPEQGASGIVWACLLPDAGPSGAFFRNKKQLDW